MVEIEPNRLHRRLKRALTAKGISQRELGRRIEATQASVSHYVKESACRERSSCTRSVRNWMSQRTGCWG